jgi:hypothetical protein
MGVHWPMSSGSRRNSSNPNVSSGRLKMSTQRSTAVVKGLDKTDQLGSNLVDMAGDDMRNQQLHRPGKKARSINVEYARSGHFGVPKLEPCQDLRCD